MTINTRGPQPEKMTLGDLIDLLKRLRLSAVVAIVGGAFVVFGTVFGFGVKTGGSVQATEVASLHEEIQGRDSRIKSLNSLVDDLNSRKLAILPSTSNAIRIAIERIRQKADHAITYSKPDDHLDNCPNQGWKRDDCQQNFNAVKDSAHTARDDIDTIKTSVADIETQLKDYLSPATK